jgi:hypothetical protein
MAKANWSAASELQSKIPHTYTAFEHLIMSMEDAYNSRGKTTFFGHDKGLKNYLKFEERLKNALIAMTMDGLINRFETSEKFREILISCLSVWFDIFPNWNAAEAFAYEKFMASPSEACNLIKSLIGLPK